MSTRQVLEFHGYRIGAAALRALPLPSAQRLAAALAGRIFDRGGERVGYALANLRIAFPELSEAARCEVGRESYVHFAWNLLDVIRSERWSDDEFKQHMRIDGLEHLEAALAKGKGALLLGPHLGNFQLGAVALPLMGVSVAWVARPMRNKLIWQHVSRQRTRTGGELISKRSAAPQILRVLRQGRVVGILNDQYPHGARAVFVPFFGVRCATTSGVATIALRSGAPVLPVYAVRDAKDHHVGTIQPALETPRSGDRQHDIEVATTAYNRAYEEVIRRYPEQYMWATRRFRHSPDLPAKPYLV